MNFWLNLPPNARYAILALAGVVLGAAVNFAACALAYERRPRSPWMRLDVAGRAEHGWLDCLPIVGWLRLRRERDLSGAWFWLRAIAVEAGLAAAVPVLYWWEVAERGLWMTLPNMFPGVVPPSVVPETNLVLAAHAMFAAHAALLAAMAAASLIDIDEKLIPDGVTVPITLFGLVSAAVYPWSRLPAGLAQDPVAGPVLDFIKVTSPMRQAWPDALGERPHASGLAIGLACFVLWVVALLPRPWRTGRGLRVAMRLLCVRFQQGLLTWQAIGLLVAGIAGVAWSWQQGGPQWIGLSSALVGMLAGGGMVWIVRVLGSVMLGREAMGFGDVTLMAMIGTFVGWQACLLAFFLAPLFALLFGVVQLAIRKDNEIYYGPFLCLATAVVAVRWRDVWGWAWPMFDLGWLVPAAMGLALVVMIFLLAIMRSIRNRLS